jgi:hypothetical protein
MQEKVKLNNLKIDWTRWVEEDEEDAKPDFGTAPSTHRSVRCADKTVRGFDWLWWNDSSGRKYGPK